MLRIPVARAILAGAAFLASAHTRAAAPAAQDAGDDTAFAVPRLAPPGGGELALPRPLAGSDARRLRRIFELQAAGDIPAAIAATSEVADETLLGHVLADRYVRPEWRGDAAQLQDWLAAYAALPDAPSIYARLAATAPKGSMLPPAPLPTTELAAPDAESAPGIARNPLLDRTVHERARLGHFASARRLIARTRGLDATYAGLLGAELAQAQFVQNQDAEALGTAEGAFRRAGGRTTLAAFVAGLSAWRLERPEMARTWFEAAWRAPDGEPGLRASAAFWAARANLRTGNPGYIVWMQRAAHAPATLYGQLARRALGLRPDRPRPADRATLGLADIDLIDGTPAGHRAFALLQVGEPARAEAELRRLWATSRDTPGLGRAIALVAQQAGLGEFATALAAMLPDAAGRLKEPGELPLPRLRPAGGFRIDPALVYGLTRVESNFDATAVSPVGATGLMQIMPETAAFLSGAPRAGRKLSDPASNLQLGQSYVLFLADALDDDLVSMLAAYNSGLGSFGRWSGEVRHMDDPLLFIEAIPNAQTRAYVARALTFTWLYAAQMQLPSPSLDELAAGLWPRFNAPTVRREPPARLH